MSPSIQFKTTTPLLLLMLVLAWFGLSLKVLATDLGSVLPNANTADGSGVLVSLTSGVNNSGFGFQALNHDTNGNANTATGLRALFSNTTGNNNTANGDAALYNNTSGIRNTGSGDHALFVNTIGNENTANGVGALQNNTSGSANTATGDSALFYNTNASRNTANGAGALEFTTTGHSNTANGVGALEHNTTGSNNTANGDSALFNNTSGAFNIALGSGAGQSLTTGSDNIDIGNSGVAGESRNIRVGTRGIHTKTFIAGISGVAVTGTAVVVNASGQLGVAVSSMRFKDEIKPMDKASEAILALKPVTFHYKKELDPNGIPQFGLIAEQVEKVNPDLVARDAKGDVYTVRYEAVNAMLLNEFLKEHRIVQAQEGTIAELKSNSAKQEATIAELKSTVAQQEKEMKVFAANLKEQAAQIQKVSAELEVGKPAPQIVLNKE
jgi:uncharacterized coiled-coil protein SlyX